MMWRCPGKIVYTQFLNKAGHIEADVTITRLSMDEFLIVAGCHGPA